MNLGEYLRDRAPVLLLNAAALLVLSVFLLLTGNTETAVFLIVFVWISVAAVWFLTDWFFRRRYFRELMSVLNDLDRKYLISEVTKPSRRTEDRLYWEILRKSNRSVIEKIRELEDGQREYKEYIEGWIHEVKTPVAAIRLICENHREEYTGRIQYELDELENEVEKVLYYVENGTGGPGLSDPAGESAGDRAVGYQRPETPFDTVRDADRPGYGRDRRLHR